MSSRHLTRSRDSRIEGYYVLTTVVRQRRRVFADPRCAACLVDSLRYVEHMGLSHSFAWVVMPDHLHWLVQLRDGTCLLYTSPSPRDVEESRMPSSA